jgi:hypothetical protein
MCVLTRQLTNWGAMAKIKTQLKSHPKFTSTL